MQFVLVIYHGSDPLPGTPEAESVSEEKTASQLSASFRQMIADQIGRLS